MILVCRQAEGCYFTFPMPAVGSGSDALIGNLHVNTEGPVPQLVLD